MRSLFALAALAALAGVPSAARAQEERPDLTGSWRLQVPDSLLLEEGGRRPEGGPGGGPGRGLGVPRDSTPLASARSLTISQTDSTVTLGGERLPVHTYYTDGREETLELQGVETVVRAWWDGADLVIERESSDRTTIESYRLDARGPRLIVIVEVQPDEETKLRPLRLHRIYQRPGETAPST